MYSKTITFTLNLILLCFTVFAVAEQPEINVRDGEWHNYRASSGLTGATSSGLPVTPVLQWTFKAGDAVESSPVVAQGKIIFGSRNGILYCVNINNGQLLWTFDTRTAIDAPPMVSGEYIYVGNLAGDFFKIGLSDGKVIWKYSCGSQIYASANSFINKQGESVIIIGAYDFMMRGLSSSTGKLLWQFKTKNFIHGAGAVDEKRGLVAFGGCDAKLRIADINSGKEVFEILLSSYIPAPPAVMDGVVYVGNYGSELTAINLDSGKICWTFGDKNIAAPFVSPPAVTATTVIIGDKNGMIHFIARATGKRIGSFQVDGEVSGILAAKDDSVLVSTVSGLLYIIDLKTLSERWKYTVGPAISASPAVVDGKIIVADMGGNLYLFSSKK